MQKQRTMIETIRDRFVIPPYLFVQTRYWLNKFPELSGHSPHRVFLNEGHQTKEYLRRRVNRYHAINGSKVLLVGCGKGEEVKTWVNWNPSEITCIDYFDYSESWTNIRSEFSGSTKTRVCFQQADITSDDIKLNGPFDIVSSDAVFEHITDPEKALLNLNALLKPSGILYAGFGPLYYTLGGDHYSGWDRLRNGYNHLVLKEESYRQYLDEKKIDSDDFDDRLFIKRGLFSRLKTDQYLEVFSKYFSLVAIDIGLSSKALRFRKRFPEKWSDIMIQNRIAETDLLVKCIFIVARKRQPVIT